MACLEGEATTTALLDASCGTTESAKLESSLDLLLKLMHYHAGSGSPLVNEIQRVSVCARDVHTWTLCLVHCSI